MKTNRRGILLFIGLIICSISQIVSHLTKTPDFVSGIIMGFGVGILILALIMQKHNPA